MNDETVSGTFVNGETITGVSNADPNVQIELTVSQGISKQQLQMMVHTYSW